MTDYLTSPDKLITFAGKEYTLRGTFEVLRGLQHAFQRDVIDIQAGILSMRQDEIARLLSVAITGSGTAMSLDEAGTLILDEYDITQVPYHQLKADLMIWLSIALTPKSSREKKRADLEKLLQEANPLLSPGRNTGDSL